MVHHEKDKLIDTIVATATPPGLGGVAVIRVSGSLVKSIAEKILHQLPKPRLALFAVFYDELNQPLDKGLALYFKAPHSFTGEDILELHCHGGIVLVDCLIQVILKQGARLARPGEFSERAFLNDKMDLTQAEAIADLIQASSEQAVRASFRSLQGDFSKKINDITESLINIRIYIEAAIDFAEEEIDFLKESQLTQQLTDLLKQHQDIKKNVKQGSLLREGITVVIAGEPNVGKSSLLNCLSQRESAIVTDIPGTTRDVLREHIVIDGLPLHMVDTAGLRDSTDQIEQEGIRRARQQMKQADLILHVVDATKDTDSLSCLEDTIPHVLIRNKIDLLGEEASVKQEGHFNQVSLSVKENKGIDFLKKIIKEQVGFSSEQSLFIARRRHLDALNQAEVFLLSALDQLTNGAGELAADDLRQAQERLGEITGEFTSDDLLGRIFSSFCIGK